MDENSIVYKHKIKSKNIYAKNLYNFHRFFALMNGGTLKLAPKMAVLTSDYFTLANLRLLFWLTPDDFILANARLYFTRHGKFLG